MSWILTKKLDLFAGPGAIKRREVELDPQVSPEEIKSREVERGVKVGLLLLQLFPISGAMNILCDCSAEQLGQQLRSTLVAA